MARGAYGARPVAACLSLGILTCFVISWKSAALPKTICRKLALSLSFRPFYTVNVTLTGAKFVGFPTALAFQLMFANSVKYLGILANAVRAFSEVEPEAPFT
jgi:hypothetical protein